jgi:hypothetical protein
MPSQKSFGITGPDQPDAVPFSPHPTLSRLNVAASISWNAESKSPMNSEDDSIYEAELINEQSPRDDKQTVKDANASQDANALDGEATEREIVTDDSDEHPAQAKEGPDPGYISAESKMLDNIASKGGAVGGFVLGLLAVAGSFITSYSIINGVIGLLLGIWGLKSNHRRLAVIGIVLSMVGVILSSVQINDLIQWWLQVQAEAANNTDI